MNKDSQGRFLPGPMSEDHRRLISEGQIRRYLRQAEQQGPRPSSKRCSQCKKTKRVPEDFPMRKRKLVSGRTTVYPAGECSMCNAERSAAWRAQLRQNSAAAQAAYRKWNANRDPEAYKRYQREYGRIRRILEGVQPRGPWKKYRLEIAVQSVTKLDPTPFLAWLEYQALTGNMPWLSETESRTLRRLADDEQEFIRLDMVDAIMTRVGQADQLHIVYPADEIDQAA